MRARPRQWSAALGTRCEAKDLGRYIRINSLLPPARIVQPLAKNGLDIEADNDEVFFELFAARDQIPIFIEDKAVAVEHKFVLSTDKIVVCNDDGIVCSARGEHLLPPLPLSGMVRRGGNVDDDLSAPGQRLLKYRTIRIPDILTDA